MAQPLDAMRVTLRWLALQTAALGLAASLLPAQTAGWGATAELGWAASGGTSHDPATGASLRPARATVVGAGIARSTGRWHYGMIIRYARSDLVIRDSAVAIETRDLQFTRFGLAPEAGLGLIRFGPHAGLHLAAGPTMDIWGVSGASTRIRVGGRAALTVESELGGRVSGVIRAEGALTGSVFESGELPPGFERRALVRSLVSVGVRVSLD